MKIKKVTLSLDKIKMYFNKPMFDFYNKWEVIDMEHFNILEKQWDTIPTKRCTRILWKNKKWRICTKIYNYQIDFNKLKL